MTPLTAAATAAVLIGVPTVAVLSVWPVAGRINTRRDNREHAAVTAYTEQVTAALVAQIREGVETATGDWASVHGDDPVALALAACRHTSVVDAYLWHALGKDHPATWQSAAVLGYLDRLNPENRLLDDYAACSTTLANAAAARLLLARLAGVCNAGDRGLVDDAIGNLAAATDALPNGCVLSLSRLTEHDPVPLHSAQAEWREAAHAAGIIDDARVPVFGRDEMRPATAPVYRPGHRYAHTNAMDTGAALDGHHPATNTPGDTR